ncbi:ABC transporter ATP-binding protein [Halapricum salinum]|uniref:Cobalamin import ATP-binding protein BtuD n=1 Tax=Halapricum salinum TaxID=1457250 RepID=A0A4D6HFY9_9EURY|nr:ABC transporter ATP-binding protein [Halapricum salinum]QCC52048.1 ABC transporter ATP-binding protein [Halapricum salinum]
MTDDETTRSDGGLGETLQRPVDDAAEAATAGSTDTAGDASEFVGEDLVLSYSTSDEPVIDEESIQVPPGEVTALVGPNGSGKSTLLKGLATQLSLDLGRVLIDGEDIESLSTKELARQLGLLSQENVSPDSLSVEKLVEHGRYPHRGFFETLTDEDRDAIEWAIEMAGVEHLRDRQVGSLSGGQKQLVWIAMVLAQETDVLLLDEPTTFLDLHHQLEVMEIVETLRDDSDITVVVVLHDIEQAARYADHVVALNDGAVYDRGSPSAVVTEELLADVFEIEAEVEVTERGPRVTPLRPLHD